MVFRWRTPCFAEGVSLLARLSGLALLLVASGLAGCMAPPTAVNDSEASAGPRARGGDDVESNGRDEGSRPPGGGDDTPDGPTASDTAALGLVVIDVQNVFVSTASQRNPGAGI